MVRTDVDLSVVREHRLADNPEQRRAQLHVDLGDADLEALVDDAAEVALRSFDLAGPDPAVLRAAMREFPRRRIFATDLCGISIFCQLAAFDPWKPDVDEG